MELTAPEPVLYIMRLSKGNALAIKGADHTIYNGHLEKGVMIKKAGCLIR